MQTKTLKSGFTSRVTGFSAMTIYLPELDHYSLSFPSPREALREPNGLLAMGGDLRPERLFQAYQQGIFPWYSIDEPILWWSPSPRAIFVANEFKPAKSLRKFYRKSNYKVSINLASEEVIYQCAALRSEEETWLDEKMQLAYTQLAKQGICHSVEVWQEEKLIGGLYGILIGSMFCGESMFSRETNASKIALWAFAEHFVAHGGEFIDCQVLNPHTASLGAIEITRDEYLSKLAYCKKNETSHHCFTPQWLTTFNNGDN